MVEPEPARIEPGPEEGLLALTFEAGDYTFAVPAALVGKILGSGRALPEGTSVVDVVGLLAKKSGEGAARGCFVLVQEPGSTAPPIALTAGRAHEVSRLNPSEILPLPAYLFGGESPFLGVITGRDPEREGAARAVFLLAGPERLSRAAASA